MLVSVAHAERIVGLSELVDVVEVERHIWKMWNVYGWTVMEYVWWLLYCELEWSGVVRALSGALDDSVLRQGDDGCLYRQLVSLNHV